MNLLLITPPFTQLNTPYPATSALTAFLQSKIQVTQCDLGIDLINRIYTREFLEKAFACTDINRPDKISQYLFAVEPVMRFLQGQDNTLAYRIAGEGFLPEGKRFQQIADLDWAFGASGVHDKAQHLATLFIQDIADFIRENIDIHFDLVRYAANVPTTFQTFEEFEVLLKDTFSIIEVEMLQILECYIQEKKPNIIGFSVPFPGCFFSALRCAQYIKKNHSSIKIVFGGGYINTEMRQISDKNIFQYIDYITLDDGELPLQKIIEYEKGLIGLKNLIRTFYITSNKVVYSNNEAQNLCFSSLPTPVFQDLPYHKYISLVELTNPMHQLWSNGCWNKMQIAHGCYWAKCAFCDTSLDYIGRYEPLKAKSIVSRMQKIAEQTGYTGFHFVDEALPPNLLKQMADEIIQSTAVFSFWGNIRFEKSFSKAFCQKLAKAGCIAVSGGLETPNDRLLIMMNKGITLKDTIQVMDNLTEAGIMVHTYLMYDFPTQTLRETIDGLEVVRQMFDVGILQSAFWHQCSVTTHSPIAQSPEKFNVSIKENNDKSLFINDLKVEKDKTYQVHLLGKGLAKATYNFMHGIGLDNPIESWFNCKVPKTSIPQNFISTIIKNNK
ncbi:MAG: B12-binding domain-containing radical SAM protein [Bacteroidales bacterium]